MYSLDTVRKILETAIDSLIDDFAREPYLHRCEHSIHCELYNMLNVHRALQGLYPLRDQGRSTTLIHKEWPETTHRQEKNGIRGNFDLAILDPKEIGKATVTDFTKGQITPAFVVEMGLNYPLKHLQDDDYKLTNSGCKKNGYLIHLWQPHRGIKRMAEDDFRKWIEDEKESEHGVAVAVFFNGKVMIKHLHDKKMQIL